LNHRRPTRHLTVVRVVHHLGVVVDHHRHPSLVLRVGT
jgi:hypothetical protein